MRLNQFQQLCMHSAKWPSHRRVEYPILALAGEAGEAANLAKKQMRAELEGTRTNWDELDEKVRKDLILEIADTMYYAAATLNDLGISMEDAAAMLFHKLSQRHGIEYPKTGE